MQLIESDLKSLSCLFKRGTMNYNDNLYKAKSPFYYEEDSKNRVCIANPEMFAEDEYEVVIITGNGKDAYHSLQDLLNQCEGIKGGNKMIALVRDLLNDLARGLYERRVILAEKLDNEPVIPEGFINLKAVSEIFKTKTTTSLSRIHDKKIERMKIGNVYYYSKKDVLKALEYYDSHKPVKKGYVQRDYISSFDDECRKKIDTAMQAGRIARMNGHFLMPSGKMVKNVYRKKDIDDLVSTIMENRNA